VTPVEGLGPSPLLRLSQLARFWELNPRTIMGWIRQGRLAAIRSPGNHFRVRVADVRAFCEREGKPVPPFAGHPPKRVLTVGPPPRGLKLPAVVLESCASPYVALVSAGAGGASLLVLPASGERFDTEAALAALRQAPLTASLPVVVLRAATRARADALRRAGATRVLLRSQAAELPAVVRDLLSLE
jgi:excisionase family DNA binding protein